MAVSVMKTTLNVGARPQFSGVLSENGLRQLEYHQDHWVEKFPLLWSDIRLADALEMNLFLEHRYKGLFRVPRRTGGGSLLGGVSIKTINSMAGSLGNFLSWLEITQCDWRQVVATANTERAKYWLPVYRYRKHLIDLVIAGKSIGRDTANLYMSHVRQFYEWARRRGTIERLPFEYKNITIKRHAEHDLNLLFSHSLGGLTVQTSDLIIPKKYKQKTLSADQLCPYSKEEVSLLYSSAHLTYPTRKLWVDLALLSGLRAFEVAGLLEDKVIDTKERTQPAYHVTIIGKGNKERQILIPFSLMQRLWLYRNSVDRLQRAALWEIEHGAESAKPLFINRSGKSISEKSISNSIHQVRKELQQKGIPFKRTFHDLRSTYATNLAKYMLDKNLDAGFIEYKLMALLGHSNFSTTRRYLNFARSVTFDSEMKGWSDTVFDGLDARLTEEYSSEIGEKNAKQE